ncbi:TlyA family RNA methyltransferase [Candidatus Saccharibacteria bacterium]|nr:TlyA family RNA methyltransferase [Candidatus Saccharibacteria bacterium]
MKTRLDQALAQRSLAPTRSQAESWIKLGKVTVNGAVVTKPGYFVDNFAKIAITTTERYVSRAGLKLASVADKFNVSFEDKIVLDVGSSTGGFTDYALQHGASKVYAVDVGTDQLHPSLRGNGRIELHEKTDIRSFAPPRTPDIVVIDVSFISLRDVLPHIVAITDSHTNILAMVKPQFEAGRTQIGSSGVIKNDAVRRTILRDFELWARQYFVVKAKADSEVKGARGNQERFYLLHRLPRLA